MHFDYRLDEESPGWAEATVSVPGSAGVEMTVSYLTDGLRHLLDAVLQLVDGADFARCEFTDEPGEHRWVFRRLGLDVHLRVFHFEEWTQGQRDETGLLVLETLEPLTEVAAGILAGMERFHAHCSPADYARQWGEHPFPSTLLRALQQEVNGSGMKQALPTLAELAGSKYRERSSSGPVACPCCHNLTLTVEGADQLCPVCYWQDDERSRQLSDNDVLHPNPVTLAEARENFRRVGACAPIFSPRVRQPSPSETL